MTKIGSSVDAAEVERFERLGEDWWNPHGSMQALHKLNPVRVAWLRDRIGAHFPTPRTAAGATCARPARSPEFRCSISAVAVGYCANRSPGSGQTSSVSTLRRAISTSRAGMPRPAASPSTIVRQRRKNLAATGARFDAVLAMEVIEHVTDVEGFVKTACAMVRPGSDERPPGLFFAATLNRTLKSFALAIVGAEYVLRWIPKGTHQWEKFVTPGELAQAMEAGGVEVIGRTGIVYHPLIDEWRSSPDMAVNYMVAGERVTA